MNLRLKQIITNPRVIILLIALLMAVTAIHPNPWNKGVAIRTVIADSAADIAGIKQPTASVKPMSRERILSINNQPINNVEEYYSIIDNLRINQTIQLKTNKGLYRLTVKEKTKTIELNETIIEEYEETIIVNETIDGKIKERNKTVTKEREVPKTETISLGKEDIGLRVYEAPTSNIKKGLDLQGGTRVLLQPEEDLNDEQIESVIDNIEQRLNVYGLSDLVVTSAGDLSGNQYIIVEIAGANEEEIRSLLAKQGKFEAKIANMTVFKGGEDIQYVCKSPKCAGIEQCSPSQGAWICNFRFKITVDQDAAERFAEATKDLKIIEEDGNKRLSEKIIFYLDDKEANKLGIAADLKGKATTEAIITGAGIDTTREKAIMAASADMKELQTILKTGSLPVKLNIVKIDAISPVLGEEFVKNAILLALMSLAMVFTVIFLRYRRLKVAIPLVIISSTELILILGIAALIGWNLDLAAIAGIIIAIGTGVDHQIVITDETLKGETKAIYNWKERIKGAFFIIMAAFFTTVVAMLPLLSAGAGLLKGFAITTIIGVSVGVFLSRPVYAKLIEILIKE